MNQGERRQYMIRSLLNEDSRFKKIPIPMAGEEQKSLLRALVNVRMPGKISRDFLAIQDAYLKEEIRAKGVTDVEDLSPADGCLYLWQGDITTLRCDAIVNAANSGMTGCYVPNHRCIDNCIHTFAGVQLRMDCARLMAAQGYEEPVGKAKLTKAYNLPCSYILHTVGPVITGSVHENDRRLLASCYTSCLALAAAHGLKSVAFCCISTGEFHFPNEEAARIAVSTVRDFLKSKSSIQKVIFNVFKDRDREIYEALLHERPESIKGPSSPL